MSSIIDKIKLPPEYDRRRKLSDEQKDEIEHKYSTGLYSLRGLAREYKVDKKTISIIVNPEVKRRNDEHIKKNWKKYQKHGKEYAEIQREHREYKKKLYAEGKIKKNK